ncbi:MAG: cohesin domain-containing protein [Candidatus Paceibacterota bacterium]|jgi:hypothetical protein
MFIKNKNLSLVFFFLFFLLSFFITKETFAATVNFSPISGTYNVGDTIKIKILVSSDQSINAVAGHIFFPSDILSIVSLSKDSSIINFWALEPSFSNTTGLIAFEGIALSGYIGDAGDIMTLIFRAESAGVAALRFSDISILANDGKGTDISSDNLFSGSINIEKTDKKINNLVAQSVASNIVEKIKEIEISNHLPSKSLLITTATASIIILGFVIIYLFAFIFRLKKYFKTKVLETKKIIFKNFKNLEKNIESQAVSSQKPEEPEMNQKDAGILREIVGTKDEIIKEVEKTENIL